MTHLNRPVFRSIVLIPPRRHRLSHNGVGPGRLAGAPAASSPAHGSDHVDGGKRLPAPRPRRVQPAIERVVSRVEAAGVPFLWISPPTMPFEDRIDVRGMWAETLAAHPTAATFPAHELSIPRGADRVHPTREANHQLARQIWLWMANQDLVP